MSRRRAHVAVGLAAVVVTPLLHWLAFPPTRVHVLAWVAFVPWFIAVRVLSGRAAAAVSAMTTLIGTYLVSSWLPRAVSVYYAQPVALGIALFVGAWTVTLAPWFLAFTACYRTIARRFTAGLPFLVAAAWAAGELGRVRLTGDPFALFGYSQADVLQLIQIADLTGVYGVGFLLVAVNTALAEICLQATSRGRAPGRVVAGLITSVAAVALALGYGLWTLRQAPDRPVPATPVAIAQANLDLGSQWRQELYGRNLEEYMRLTAQAAASGPPALVVWPESAMTFFVEDEPLYRASLASVLAPRRLQLLAGGVRAVGSEEPRYYNSAFVIGADGTVAAHYDKQRLLPFAEYFPFASIALLRREFARVREFTPGGPAALLPTVAGPAGIAICNEALFPEMVGDRVRAGAAFLVN
ncbi:MAG TPA: apolipoprotein N-acyltransferase, partial [Solirubrobacteraceae bacterium]